MTKTLLGLTTKLKHLIEKKNHLFKSYMANGILTVGRKRLQKAGAELIKIIKSSKKTFATTLRNQRTVLI